MNTKAHISAAAVALGALVLGLSADPVAQLPVAIDDSPRFVFIGATQDQADHMQWAIGRFGSVQAEPFQPFVRPPNRRSGVYVAKTRHVGSTVPSACGICDELGVSDRAPAVAQVYAAGVLAV